MSRGAEGEFQPWTTAPSTSRPWPTFGRGQTHLLRPRASAFVLDVADREPQQLDRGVVGGEVATALDDLAAELVVQGLDRVRGLDDLAEFGWERGWVALAPGRGGERIQLQAGGLVGRGRCRSGAGRRRPSCGRSRRRTASLRAAGARCRSARCSAAGRLDRLREPGQAVAAHDQHVTHAALITLWGFAQLRAHSGPEVSRRRWSGPRSRARV